jgi:hypothetical protein
MENTHKVEEKVEGIVPQYTYHEKEDLGMILFKDQETIELQALVEQDAIESLYTFNDQESSKLISEIEYFENAQVEINEIDQINDYQNYKDSHPYGDKLSGYDSEILKWHFNLLNQQESLEFYKYSYDAEFYSDLSVLIFVVDDIIGLITLWYIGDTIEDSYLIGDCLSDVHCSYIIDDWISSGKTAYNLCSKWS